MSKGGKLTKELFSCLRRAGLGLGLGLSCAWLGLGLGLGSHRRLRSLATAIRLRIRIRADLRPTIIEDLDRCGEGSFPKPFRLRIALLNSESTGSVVTSRAAGTRYV